MASKKEIDRLRKLGVIQQYRLTSRPPIDIAEHPNHSYFESLMQSSSIRGDSWKSLSSKLETHINDEKRILEEWKGLSAVEKRKDILFSDGRLDCNRSKNRYQDVLPYNSTRVRLVPTKGVPGSDYINASYVTCGRMQFIAAQAPTEDCISDWYRMIWEFRCSSIIMLTRWVELGRVKADNYLPELNESKVHGNITVQLVQEEEPSEHFVIRLLKLKMKGEEREVLHYHYLAWPDQGVPSNTSSILEMMSLIYKAKSFTLDNQQIVHCSAGVGRSGAWIVIAALLEEITHELGTNNLPEINVLKSVEFMRGQRDGMVQNIDQYKLVYKTISDHVSKIIGSVMYKETIRTWSEKRAKTMRSYRTASKKTLEITEESQPEASPLAAVAPLKSISTEKVTTGSVADVIKSGWLSMPRGFSWKKLWFVLTGNTLFIYKDQKEESVVKLIPLPRGSLVEEESMITRHNTLHIMSNRKHYNFSAASEEEKQEWMDAIKKVIQSQPEITEQPTPEIQVLQIQLLNLDHIGSSGNQIKPGFSFRFNIKLIAGSEKKPMWKTKTQWVKAKEAPVVFNELFNTIDRNITPLLKIHVRVERLSPSSLASTLETVDIPLDKFISSQRESEDITAVFPSNLLSCSIRVGLVKMSSNPKRRKTNAPIPEPPPKKVGKSQVFGVSLEQQVEFQKSKFPDKDVPYFIDECIAAIFEMEGTSVEGLFRIPANYAEIQQLKEAIDQNLSTDVKGGGSVHNPAALLKLWLRELPEPLIPMSSYEACIFKPEKAFDIITQLPELNRKVLVKLLDFLYIMIKPENVQHTRMPKENLAMIFAPCLLLCPYTDPFQILQGAKMEAVFVIALLSNPDIMGIEADDKQANSNTPQSTESPAKQEESVEDKKEEREGPQRGGSFLQANPRAVVSPAAQKGSFLQANHSPGSFLQAKSSQAPPQAPKPTPTQPPSPTPSAPKKPPEKISFEEHNRQVRMRGRTKVKKDKPDPQPVQPPHNTARDEDIREAPPQAEDLLAKLSAVKEDEEESEAEVQDTDQPSSFVGAPVRQAPKIPPKPTSSIQSPPPIAPKPSRIALAAPSRPPQGGAQEEAPPMRLHKPLVPQRVPAPSTTGPSSSSPSRGPPSRVPASAPPSRGPLPSRGPPSRVAPSGPPSRGPLPSRGPPAARGPPSRINPGGPAPSRQGDARPPPASGPAPLRQGDTPPVSSGPPPSRPTQPHRPAPQPPSRG